MLRIQRTSSACDCSAIILQVLVICATTIPRFRAQVQVSQFGAEFDPGLEHAVWFLSGLDGGVLVEILVSKSLKLFEHVAYDGFECSSNFH